VTRSLATRSVSPVWNPLGFRFTVSVDRLTVRDHVSTLLAALPSAEPGGESAEFPITEDPDNPTWLSRGLGDLVSGMNLGSIEAAEGQLLLHAGAVARQDGGCLVMCGPSGSGKSTLTARLLAEGFTYVTDETVCIDPEWLTITPYRKPLSLKPGSHALYPELAPADELPGLLAEGDTWLVAPSRLGPTTLPTEPLRPQLLVFPTFSTEAEPSVRRLSLGEAAFFMGRDSSRLRLVRGGPLAILSRVARRVPAYRVIHRDHRSAADTVRGLWDEVAACRQTG